MSKIKDAIDYLKYWAEILPNSEYNYRWIAALDTTSEEKLYASYRDIAPTTWLFDTESQMIKLLLRTTK